MCCWETSSNSRSSHTSGTKESSGTDDGALLFLTSGNAARRIGIIDGPSAAGSSGGGQNRPEVGSLTVRYGPRKYPRTSRQRCPRSRRGVWIGRRRRRRRRHGHDGGLFHPYQLDFFAGRTGSNLIYLRLCKLDFRVCRRPK